jgi:hypothetical protein
MIDDRPLAIDLCAGLCGWGEGLIEEGWRVRAYDIEDMFTALGEARPEHVELIVRNVLEMHGSEIADAGRHIPMIVENVKGAQPWVGRAAWNYGSFFLWGDIPALMPIQRYHHRLKVKAGEQWNVNRENFTGTRGWDEGTKNTGGSWFNIGSPGQKVVAQNHDGRLVHRRNGAPHTKRLTNPAEHVGEGRKQPGLSGPRNNGKGDRWFQDGAAQHGSKSSARKAASAKIAKIPLALSSHIARVYRPERAAA